MAFGGIVGKQTTTYTNEEIQEIVNNAVSGSLKFTTGNYTGDGATTKSITLSGPVVLILVYSEYTNYFSATNSGAWNNFILYIKNEISNPYISVHGQAPDMVFNDNVSIELSNNNKTIKMSSSYAVCSMNVSNIKYYYSAIIQ